MLKTAEQVRAIYKEAGFWESPTGGTIGDGGADILGAAIDAIEQQYLGHPELERKPTSTELMETLKFVLNGR